MLDIVFIILIFIEIFLTYYIVGKIIVFEKNVNTLNQKVMDFAPKVEEVLKRIHDTLSKINRVIRILNNKKLIQAKKIIFATIEIIQIILILKSLDFSRGFRFNFKNLKKLVLSQSVRYTINKLIKFASAV